MGLFKKKYWQTPQPAEILPEPPPRVKRDMDEIQSEFDKIFIGLHQLGFICTLTKYDISSAVVQYYFELADVRNLRKALRCDVEIAALTGKQVIIAPVTNGGGHFSITVPLNKRITVHLRDTMLKTGFDSHKSNLACVLGETTDNNSLILDLSAAPHLLIAGSSGGGKSVLLHSIICSQLFRNTPTCTKYLFIDTKQVELTMYESIPHLLQPVATNVGAAVRTLNETCRIMDERYALLRRNPNVKLNNIVVVIDELADLMLQSKKTVEPMIVRIASLGRAAKVHLIISTQRPTVNVVTGLIKANMPTRVALTMAGYRDSGVIEIPGAHKLSGMGDALYQSKNHATDKAVRFQGAFISNNDIAKVAAYWKDKKRCMLKK